MNKLKVNLTESRFSSEQLKAIKTHWSSENARVLNLRKYFNADNVGIAKKEAKRDISMPNNKSPFAYGRILPLTTIGYMLKRDPEITVQNSPDYQTKLGQIIREAGGYSVLKKSLSDCITYGVGYNLIYQTAGKNSPVTFRMVALDPAECVPVYNYDIEPKLIALVRFYTVEKVEYTDIWYYDAMVTSKRDAIRGQEFPHAAGRVPVSVCSADMGVAEPVLGLIDALDVLCNEDLNELQKFAMAIRIAYGVNIEDVEIKKADSGEILMIPNALDGKARLEYLTREINDTFHGNMREFLIAQIHKLSNVPDFADPSFAAFSGIALEYKFMGFENVCGMLEMGMVEAIKETLETLSVLHDLAMPANAELWVSFSRNLPRDDSYKMQVAAAMSRIGLSRHIVLTYLSDYIDDIEKELVRQEEQNKSLFPQELRVDADEPENVA